MKKTILTTIVLFASGAVFANTAFTPISLTDASAAQPAQQAAAEDVLGNSKIQNAILQIDNAQTEIRNQLLG